MTRRRFPTSGAHNENLSRSTSVGRSDEGMNPDDSDGGDFNPSPGFLPGCSESPAPSHPAPLEMVPESRNPPRILNPQARDSGNLVYIAEMFINIHVLEPLAKTQSLRDFHQFVRDCTRRIMTKELICLRDLEKTLLLDTTKVVFHLSNNIQRLAD
jgi:hypothetical protein